MNDCSKLGRVLTALNTMQLSDKHVIIGCTVLPGYNQSIGQHLLRGCSSTSLSYSPEFIQQGDIVHGFLNPDMVLIGEGCKEVKKVVSAPYHSTFG
jgi:UDP-glucose 6-dehydrogenase